MHTRPAADLHPLNLTPPPARVLYLVEAMASAGTNLLIIGIFFYTAQRYGWNLGQNFLLAAGQGAVYVIGALLADRLASRLPRRVVLGTTYLAMALVAAAGTRFTCARAMTLLLLAYSALAGITWPILESLASTGVPPLALSVRIAVYNLVWSGVGAVMVAINGTIIDRWPAGVFLLPALLHLVSAPLLALDPSRRFVQKFDRAAEPAAAPLQPEPELLRVRTLALWLSRMALPATYVVIYSLMALMPSLPVMKSLDATTQTLVGSTWMISRWLTFIVLGFGVWWHTRPRVMLLAAVAMLVSFARLTAQPSHWFGSVASPQTLDLTAMILWQIVLGVTLGMIYSASLYFGMVLSEGSTEHSGYHEALIGLGSVLGPGAGAITQWVRPGDINLGIRAVGSVIALSVLAALVGSAILRRHEPE